MISVTHRHRLLVLLLGLIAWFPTLKTGFFWDDQFIILQNPSLAHWTDAPKDFVRPIFQDPNNNFYRPLLPLSLRIDRNLWGFHALGYHLVNLAIHIANSVLLISVVLLLGATPLTALLTAALFVVHPMIVQNLLMIVGRDELLSFFFSLCSILALSKSEKKGAIFGAVFFVASFLSKESGISTFFFFLLTAGPHLPRSSYWKRAVVLLVISIGYVLLIHKIVPSISIPFDVHWLAAFLLKGVPQILCQYAAKVYWPTLLYSDRMLTPAGTAWPAYTLALLAIIVFLTWKRSRLATVCVLWFAIGLAPKLPKTLLSSMVLDHWVYPSLLGALLPLAAVLSSWWNDPQSWIRFSMRGACAFLIFFWTLLAHVNVIQRGTPETFFAWSNRFHTSPTLRMNYAAILISQQRWDEAERILEKLLKESPDNETAEKALTYCLQQQKRS